MYVLLKILGDRVIHIGDENLNKLSQFYPLIKVLKTENTSNYQYKVGSEHIEISNNDVFIKKILISDFVTQAASLLSSILSGSGSSFAIPDIETFMQTISVSKVKADLNDKTDIKLVIHDMRTNMTPTLGFSIKSHLGNPSTLLNSSKLTNFVYSVDGKLSDADIAEINSIATKSKIKDRIRSILSKGCKISYYDIDGVIFKNNIILIDSYLPQIIGAMLIDYGISNRTSVKQLSERMTIENPLSFDIGHSHNYYKYKMKRFLTDVALGMIPKTVWNGDYEANGGYLIVKKDGDVLCYHIYDKKQFENYLINNTRFDMPSSSRHKFGIIYKNDNRLFIKLNLQIRFVS